MTGTVSLQQFTGAQAAKIRDTVADVQADGYADAIAAGDPFEATDEFMRRFDTYVTAPGFTMLLATLDGHPVGQTFGWPLQPTSKWWADLVLDPGPPDHAEFVAEDGTRTFALSEIMVDKQHTGSGIASTLYRALLGGRPEQRATWLVNPANDKAYPIYLHWGARRVGTLRPRWDGAPQYDVLVVELPLTLR
jgi:GNAT superfamily N-acetyltransferase